MNNTIVSPSDGFDALCLNGPYWHLLKLEDPTGVLMIEWKVIIFPESIRATDVKFLNKFALEAYVKPPVPGTYAFTAEICRAA